ncbi:MAG: phosphatidylglycerophosphatase A [Candidatus Hydrogenedentota bacterium]|nr:MAG: phosphatidylglycerophosphatase A [Candidatus Hydrogenedentota bacterium]
MKKIHFDEFIATGFYVGYLPIMPGTWASWVACAIPLFLYELFPDEYRLLLSVFVVLFFFLGIFSADAIAIVSRRSDPGFIVIDEWVGQWIPFLFVLPNPTAILIGFIFFRIFDITKIPPIAKLENLGGGLGIMLDDVMAGFYAGIALYFTSLFIR